MGRNGWVPHVIPIHEGVIKNNCPGTVIPEGCHITSNCDKSVLIDLTLSFVERIYNSVSYRE